MITERLGDLGYPLDDKQRTVSTLGNELRIVRKQLAHMYDFSTVEAFRANDFCVRLLTHFEDGEGADEAKNIRHNALAALAVEAGVTEQVAATTVASPAATQSKFMEETTQSADDAETEFVTPDPEVLEREPSVIGAKRLEFEPWTVVQMDDVDVLEDLPKKVAKEKVRTVAVEIATYEGPVHLDRLVQLTAKSFGRQRVHSGRAKKIAYQIRQAGLFVDAHQFVWPREIDPGSWSEFRPNDSNADRPFIHISPVEIANAARFISAKRPAASEDALDAAVLQTFGRKRRTEKVAAHLIKAKEHL